jgi:membrane-associated phospholipid phosphatase
MADERASLGKFGIRATDGLLLATLALMTLLTVVFHRRVDGWATLTLKNLGAATAYLVLLRLSERSRDRARRFFLRLAGVLFAFSYINLAVEKLQLIIYGRWLDGNVLRLENALFGVQPTLWLQQFISRPLTEWMFFSYVIYLVIYPALGVLIFFRRGEEAGEDYLFALGLSNVVCDLGFLLYPVAGPMFYMGGQYRVPLDGFVWTWLGEQLRSHWQFVGGTIPSPHCANATVMWLMAYRYHRASFWALSPVILSLYLSTVYCRYHYVTDSVAGVAAALLVWAAAPACQRAWDGIVERRAKRCQEARA